MNVLFVCTGNTCRSPIAEHLLKKMLEDAGVKDVNVQSAGIRPATWLKLPKEAQAALESEGIKDVKHAPQGLEKKLIDSADLIFVMEDHHRRSLIGRFPEAESKTKLLDPEGISDPYGLSQEIYNSALAQIKTALVTWLESIQRRP